MVEIYAAPHHLALGLHALGRVGDDAAVIYGILKDRRQHAVGALDRRGGPVVAEGCDPFLDRRPADVADPHIPPARFNMDAPSDLERFQR